MKYIYGRISFANYSAVKFFHGIIIAKFNLPAEMKRQNNPYQLFCHEKCFHGKVIPIAILPRDEI